MEEDDYKKQRAAVERLPSYTGTKAQTLAGLWYHRRLVCHSSDEVLEELVRIGVGHRRTESVSWDLFVSRGKGSGQAGAVSC